MDLISVNDKKFFIKQLLGKGKGGYSYLVENEQNEEFVVKQIHHEPCDYYNFGNKIEAEKNDYKRLCETGILILVKNDALPHDAILQLEDMAQKVKEFGLNIDYFPTNFVLQSGRFYYIDYECNSYMAEWNFENWGIKYWSKTKEFLDYLIDHHDL